MKSLSLVILLVALATSPASGQIPQSPGGDPLYRVSLPSGAPDVLRAALELLGYDVDGFPAEPSAVQAIVSSAEFQALASAGLNPAILETAQPLAKKLSGGLDLPAGYHDLTTINNILFATQTNYPTLAKVVNVAATHGPGATYENRPIYAIKISDNAAADEDEPEVIIVSNHHAREIVTPEIALDIIDRLTVGYATDPAIKALVDQYEIWVAPTWNPDGLDYVWTTNNMWRKNRKPTGSYFGIDLNRNYSLGWSGPCAGSTSPSSDTYKGPSAESEEETQTMVAWSRARRFAKVLDFHSSGREVLLSYLCSPIPSAIESYIDAEGTSLANSISYLTRQPSAEGEHYEWQISEHTSYAYLAETATEFQPAYSAAVAEAAIVWPLVFAFLQKSIPLTGHVTDAKTGAPLEAKITVSGVTWSLGETRKSEPLYGRYHQFLPAGTWQLTFAADGYLPQTISATVNASSTVVKDVALTPQSYHLFGQGCPGTGVVGGGMCAGVNTAGGTSTASAYTGTYAYQFTALEAMTVSGFRLWTGSSTGGSVVAATGFYTSAGSGPAATPTATSTIQVGGPVQFYDSTFPKAISVPAGATCYVSCVHDQVFRSDLTAGESGVAYYSSGSGWSMSGFVDKPSFQIICLPTTNAVPEFAVSGTAAIGTAMTMKLSKARPTTMSLLFTGVSDKLWAGIPLPLNLGGLGAPLCDLLVGMNITLGVPVNASGEAQLTGTIPNQTSLIGAVYYQQFGVIDPGANALGYALTNGAAVTITN